MAKTGALLAVLVGATFAVLLFSPLTNSVVGLSEPTTVTNEIVEADLGDQSDLRGYQLTDDPVTVEEYNTSSETWRDRTLGTDYTVDREGGTITALEDGEIEDGARLRVDYTYQKTGETTGEIWGFLPLLLALLIAGILGSNL